MKKIIAAILTVVICIAFFVGCDASVVEANMLSRFKIEHASILNYDELTVISDSETGVMYLIYDGSNNNPGGITVMVDKNGNPLISDEYSGE